MIDDGEFAGIPIGGLGTGSIGRTYRGDAARWHLEVGRHRHEPVAADAFSVFVGGPDGSRATVLSALRPDQLPGVGLGPAGRRRRLSRPLPAGLAGLRAGPARDPAHRRAALPGDRGRPRVERPPGRRLRVVGREPGTGAADGRAHALWADPFSTTGAAPGRPHEVAGDAGLLGVRFGDATDDAPTALRGSLAIAALGGDGVDAQRPCHVRPGPRHRPVGRFRVGWAPERPWTGVHPRGSATAGRDRSRRRGDRGAGTGRAAVRAIRADLGPAGRRVRRGTPLVEALHARLGPERRPRLGPGPPCARRGAGLAVGDRGAGRRRSSTTRSARTGTRWRSSTSCTSSSTAARSGSTARWAAPSPTPTTPGGSRCSSASTTRSTTRSTSTSTPRSRCSSCSPSSRCAGSATSSRRSRSTTPRSSPSRRRAGPPRASSAGPCRTTSGVPPTTRSTGPTGTSTRTSTTGRTSGPSSCCRPGATRSPPPRPRATP